MGYRPKDWMENVKVIMPGESIEFWKEWTQDLRVGTLCDVHVYCRIVRSMYHISDR